MRVRSLVELVPLTTAEVFGIFVPQPRLSRSLNRDPSLEHPFDLQHHAQMQKLALLAISGVFAAEAEGLL